MARGSRTTTTMPDGDLGCGGAEHICFEKDVESVRPGNWMYTGKGGGAYEKIEDMHYVGEGRGSWDRERLAVHSWRCSSFCLCFCGLLLLALAGWLVAFLLHRHSNDSVGMDVVPALHDCTADYFHWETAWPPAKKAWCCSRLGRGCETTSAPLDCSSALGNWKKAWSDAKKEYCCSHEKLGCPGDDCHDGAQDTWSHSKKLWCCAHHDLACPKDAYDCRAGVTNWRHGWSERKKYFCCKKYDVACPTAVAYDCGSGIPWQWPSTKKAWCCQHGHRCETDTHPFDCSAGYASWRTYWSATKAAWCCIHERRGCHTVHHHIVPVTVPVPSPPRVHVVYHSHPVPVPVPVPVVVHGHHGYDCWHGHTWSPSKRHYCCSKHQLGCQSSHVHVVHIIHHVHGHFDCQAGLSRWQVGWSDTKKHWCCAEYKIACPGNSGPKPYVTSSIVHRYENGDTYAGRNIAGDSSLLSSGGDSLAAAGESTVSAGHWGEDPQVGGWVTCPGSDQVCWGTICCPDGTPCPLYPSNPLCRKKESTGEALGEGVDESEGGDMAGDEVGGWVTCPGSDQVCWGTICCPDGTPCPLYPSNPLCQKKESNGEALGEGVDESEGGDMAGDEESTVESLGDGVEESDVGDAAGVEESSGESLGEGVDAAGEEESTVESLGHGVEESEVGDAAGDEASEESLGEGVDAAGEEAPTGESLAEGVEEGGGGGLAGDEESAEAETVDDGSS